MKKLIIFGITLNVYIILCIIIFRKTSLQERQKSHVDNFMGVTLMFIIIDDFPHELIWRTWLDIEDDLLRNKCSIYFHAKFPERVQSSWVKSRLVNFNFRPTWGSVEITKVMVKMLEYVR